MPRNSSDALTPGTVPVPTRAVPYRGARTGWATRLRVAYPSGAGLAMGELLLETIRDALELIGPDRRRKFVAVGLLATIVSALESVAALLVLVLMRLVLEPGEIPEVPILGDVTRFFPTASFQDLVLWFTIAFGLFMLLRSAAFMIQQYAIGRVAENTGVLLADRLFDGYLSMPYEFHLRRNSAELIRNAYDNVGQIVNSVFAPMATVFAESMLVVTMIGVLVVVSPVATLAAVALMLVAVAVTFAIVQPRLRRLGRERQKSAKSAMQHLQQGLGGLRDVKILGREQGFATSFRGARGVMARSEYLKSVLAYVPRVSIETALMGFVLGAVVIATFQDNIEGMLATVGLFAYAGLRLQPSLQKIATSLNNLRYAQAAVDDLKHDMAHVDASVAERRALDIDPMPLPFEDRVSFEGVTFRYAGSDLPALSDVDLEVRKGESIGVCGHTGGGKTTLLDLLCGLLVPSVGRITVDGKDLAVHSRAWQRSLGVVHQSSFLTDDTLARNIAFGVDLDDIDLDALLLAVEVAQLQDLVAGLDDGLETVVGERGVRLSGGQRQRVTLARAIYRRPEMLVLDEGTSALDHATEAAVVDGLRRLPGNVTLVMVAHRLSSIRDCDRIVFVDGGHIAGIGTYDELRATNDAFRTIAA